MVGNEGGCCIGVFPVFACATIFVWEVMNNPIIKTEQIHTTRNRTCRDKGSIFSEKYFLMVTSILRKFEMVQGKS